MGRKRKCDCGCQLGYAVIKGTTLLHCDYCERDYPLKERARELPKYIFDDTDTVILKYVNSVSSCTPSELAGVTHLVSSTIIRRVHKLVKKELVHAQKKQEGLPPRFKWYYYPTGLLRELAQEKGW